MWFGRFILECVTGSFPSTCCRERDCGLKKLTFRSPSISIYLGGSCIRATYLRHIRTRSLSYVVHVGGPSRGDGLDLSMRAVVGPEGLAFPSVRRSFHLRFLFLVFMSSRFGGLCVFSSESSPSGIRLGVRSGPLCVAFLGTVLCLGVGPAVAQEGVPVDCEEVARKNVSQRVFHAICPEYERVPVHRQPFPKIDPEAKRRKRPADRAFGTPRPTTVSEVQPTEANLFTRAAGGLEGASSGSMSVADVDGDGNADILLTGGGRTKICLGTGLGDFTKADESLEWVQSSSISVGDVDNDGHPDLLRHALQLDVSNLASGTYFLRLNTEEATRTERVTVLR